MSDDLVKRLSDPLPAWRKAQAAEITRLRAALATARNDALALIKEDTDELIEQGRKDGMEIARRIDAALEGGKK